MRISNLFRLVCFMMLAHGSISFPGHLSCKRNMSVGSAVMGAKVKPSEDQILLQDPSGPDESGKISRLPQKLKPVHACSCWCWREMLVYAVTIRAARCFENNAALLCRTRLLWHISYCRAVIACSCVLAKFVKSTPLTNLLSSLRIIQQHVLAAHACRRNLCMHACILIWSTRSFYPFMAVFCQQKKKKGRYHPLHCF